MSKKPLDLIKFGEQEFRLNLYNEYFGKIRAIQNDDKTGYAVIYEQNIPAISGPPMNREIYLEAIKSLNDLEEVAEAYSKKIAKKYKCSLNNLANLSEDKQFFKRATDPERLKHFVKITKEILQNPKYHKK